jgi:hypothetical protein
MDSAISGIVVLSVGAIIPIVNRLTKQELWVLCVVFSLLLVGLAVKTWREAHPSPGVTQSDNH